MFSYPLDEMNVENATDSFFGLYAITLRSCSLSLEVGQDLPEDDEEDSKEIEFTPEEADALNEYLGTDYICPISKQTSQPNAKRCKHKHIHKQDFSLADSFKTLVFKYMCAF